MALRASAAAPARAPFLPLVQRGTNEDNIQYALDIATGALTYYETVFDIDYPLPKVGAALGRSGFPST